MDKLIGSTISLEGLRDLKVEKELSFGERNKERIVEMEKGVKYVSDEEMAGILNNKELMADIAKAKEDIKNGKYVSWEGNERVTKMLRKRTFVLHER